MKELEKSLAEAMENNNSPYLETMQMPTVPCIKSSG